MQNVLTSCCSMFVELMHSEEQGVSMTLQITVVYLVKSTRCIRSKRFVTSVLFYLGAHSWTATLYGPHFCLASFMTSCTRRIASVIDYNGSVQER